MSRSETALHLQLKRVAAAWAYDRGFRSLAFEVPAPRSSFRVDVAAYRAFRNPEAAMCPGPIVAVFECKRSRADLLRDNHRRARLQEQLSALQERRVNLERLLRIHHPHLCRGDSLFPEFDTFDASLLDHRGYRLTLTKISRIQHQLEGGTKFDQMGRYRLADLHYLVTPIDLIRAEEIPFGWGLLELHPSGGLRESATALRFSCSEHLRWLERIAKAATVALLRNQEIGSES
ncbi:MAG: hypothetical protein JO069_20025 [Verrucomicrobia bacterium]|nr:hypothetical protein [Verrucomicrobiota bacterium]